jgi:hypothetical protein
MAGPDFGGNYTCLERIEWLITADGKNETAACSQVSSEFPDICGTQCNPVSGPFFHGVCLVIVRLSAGYAAR